MKRNTCLIVDPASTGVHLAPALRRLGVRVAAGFSNTGAPLDPDIYEQSVEVGDGSIWPEALDPARVLRVIAGSDPGVLPADRLTELAGIPGLNDPALSSARRDKWAMGEALRNAGTPSARQALLTNRQEVETWITKNPGASVAVKPRRGMASDQVILCHSDTETRTAADALLGTIDFFGNDNTTVLVQEFLQGAEFMVDTVSRDGTHYVTGVWQAWRQRSGKVLPLQADAADPASSEAQRVVAYCSDVLDALGVANGPAHTEIMLVSGRGPVLVELNARFHGSLDLGYARRVFGIDQVTETARSIADTDWRGPNQMLELKSFGRKIYLHSPISGIAARAPDYSALERLGSFHSIRSRIVPGKEFLATESLSTCPATLFLVAESEAEITADTQKVRELEAAIYRHIVSD
ncbi:hypothetical protein AA12717_1864 [Gluconacetobacter sacchari DSM 12717]|uniref:ATP-grasp domain-containing protein n=2 Tax=Gluconacetobacter sacchari TaxID=92759 RepID=A0A7W4IGU7_9PROT|nr:ATP-grasp domain-containing protein [Gluconacetobacter sacchari]MBB2162452.1 ATP-grasp domain-containing protein [Gluconacetobacter sacchari]GBQ24708.1 hypothetical protein AA12717_1864 [Gluconacetobacter sacchari DSM 12717]